MREYEECHGKWIEIAKHMCGRNISQCAQRWRRLNPNKSEVVVYVL